MDLYIKLVGQPVTWYPAPCALPDIRSAGYQIRLDSELYTRPETGYRYPIHPYLTMSRVRAGRQHCFNAGPPLRQARHEGHLQVQSSSDYIIFRYSHLATISYSGTVI